jgi:hypothetical protein
MTNKEFFVMKGIKACDTQHFSTLYHYNGKSYECFFSTIFLSDVANKVFPLQRSAVNCCSN